MVQILKNWIQYKYRDRIIVRRLDGKPVKQEYVKPANIDESYIFKMRDEFDLNNYRSLYDAFRSEFTKLVNEIFIKKNKLGKRFPNGRNSISFHSLRWFVRTSVKEATNDEALAFFWVGKENVKYEFDATGKKLLDKYKLIEPALTFLDPKIITKIGEGQQAQIDYLNKQNKELEKQMLNQKKELKKEFLIYRFEQEINSYQEFIVSKYERTGENIAPVTPDIPKNFVKNLLELERKDDANLTLEEMCFVKVRDIVHRLHSLNAEDEKILDEYIKEEFDGNENWVCLTFNPIYIIAAMSDISPNEVRKRRLNLMNPKLVE